MPKSDWVKACMFAVILQTFHHLGLLRYFAIYLNKEKNVSYYDFYNMLYDYIYKQSKGYMNEFFTDLYRRKADTRKAEWTYQRDVFGTTGWYFEEGSFLEMVYHFDSFREEIKPFLMSFGIEDELFVNLFNYQESLIRKPFVNSVTVKSQYDFYHYFAAVDEGRYEPLRKTANTLEIVAHKNISSWAEYAREIIWFGKRYSATLLVNPKNTINFKFE